MSSSNTVAVAGSSSSSSSSNQAAINTLKNPDQGSVNPTSLPSLWNYVEPALRHILCTPTTTPGKAPTIDVAYHVGIHTAVYNYFTSQSESPSVYVPSKPNGKGKDLVASGTDLYDQLDRYFAQVAQENLLGIPSDDSTLLEFYVPSFNRYSTGIQSINRLLNYVNRHYVKRSVDEDKGWLRLTDVLDAVAKTITSEDTRDKISAKLREKRSDELKRWGYEDGGSTEMMTAAEASAEAASSPDRVIPVVSLGHRRWRTEVIEPLLSVPKAKGKRKGKPLVTTTNAEKGPRGRLARAVKDLIEGPYAREPSSIELAASLAASLRVCGIRIDHPLRKKLDKFLATSQPV
ncbi:Cullin repeat-like-containing domain protein [Hysterangium stoloniferum]|nr:Cullin repeat-like-containing domain protein [Hysterangium stoloniferum]